MNAIATCIGCGCTDVRACADGCHWLRVDRTIGQGVCGKCPGSVPAWDARVQGQLKQHGVEGYLWVQRPHP